MRKSWIKISLLLTLSLLFSACLDTQETKKETSLNENSSVQIDKYGIPWAKDLPTAFSLAKKENKNLLVMAVSVGCGWCKKIKERTLSEPKVAKHLEKYILVQADRETPHEREQLPPFKHVPIIFFMTPNKEVIDNLRGYFQAEDFLEYMLEMEED